MTKLLQARSNSKRSYPVQTIKYLYLVFLYIASNIVEICISMSKEHSLNNDVIKTNH